MTLPFNVYGRNEGWEIRRGTVYDEGHVGFYCRFREEAQGWCMALNSAYRLGYEAATTQRMTAYELSDELKRKPVE